MTNTRHTDNPFRHRNPHTVAAIIGYIYDANEPVPWHEITTHLAGTGSPRTIERIIYELAKHGAIYRLGKPADHTHPDTRTLIPTVLGRYWLDRELAPTLTDNGPDEADEETNDDDDPY